jgi:hypothetical protein
MVQFGRCESVHGRVLPRPHSTTPAVRLEMMSHPAYSGGATERHNEGSRRPSASLASRPRRLREPHTGHGVRSHGARRRRSVPGPDRSRSSGERLQTDTRSTDNQPWTGTTASCALRREPLAAPSASHVGRCSWRRRSPPTIRRTTSDLRPSRPMISLGPSNHPNAGAGCSDRASHRLSAACARDCSISIRCAPPMIPEHQQRDLMEESGNDACPPPSASAPPQDPLDRLADRTVTRSRRCGCQMSRVLG